MDVGPSERSDKIAAHQETIFYGFWLRPFQKCLPLRRRVCRILRRVNQLVCRNELAAAIDTRESAIKMM